LKAEISRPTGVLKIEKSRDPRRSLAALLHSGRMADSEGDVGYIVGAVIEVLLEPVYDLVDEKPRNILKPNLAGVTISVRYTNSANLVQISCEMAAPRGGEM